MTQLGRLHDTLLRPNGTPAAGASVEIRRQGATVTANQSSTAPFVVTVADPGAIQPGDTVAVGLGSTTYAVTATAATTVTLDGFAGTLALNQGDRLSPTNALPTLYADDQAVNTLSGGNPTSTDTNGEFAAWAPVAAYDLRVTGGGFTPRLFQDVYPAGLYLVQINCSPDAAGVAIRFDAKHLPSTGKILALAVDGVDKFFVNADGTISGTVAVSVPDPLSLVNGLTVGGLATFNNGAGVIGGLTVDNFTGTGTFTVAAGAIASAALATDAASAAAVTTRGGSANVALLSTETSRISVSYTPVGTGSKNLIAFNGMYSMDASNTNLRYVEVLLYIDSVLKFNMFGGPTLLGINESFLVPMSFFWIESGLSNAAHTIEIRDKYIQAYGAAASANYRGDLVRGALIIEELKK